MNQFETKTEKNREKIELSDDQKQKIAEYKRLQGEINALRIARDNLIKLLSQITSSDPASEKTKQDLIQSLEKREQHIKEISEKITELAAELRQNGIDPEKIVETKTQKVETTGEKNKEKWSFSEAKKNWPIITQKIENVLKKFPINHEAHKKLAWLFEFFGRQIEKTTKDKEEALADLTKKLSEIITAISSFSQEQIAKILEGIDTKKGAISNLNKLQELIDQNKKDQDGKTKEAQEKKDIANNFIKAKKDLAELKNKAPMHAAILENIEEILNKDPSSLSTVNSIIAHLNKSKNLPQDLSKIGEAIKTEKNLAGLKEGLQKIAESQEMTKGLSGTTAFGLTILSYFSQRNPQIKGFIQKFFAYLDSNPMVRDLVSQFLSPAVIKTLQKIAFTGKEAPQQDNNVNQKEIIKKISETSKKHGFNEKLFYMSLQLNIFKPLLTFYLKKRRPLDKKDLIEFLKQQNIRVESKKNFYALASANIDALNKILKTTQDVYSQNRFELNNVSSYECFKKIFGSKTEPKKRGLTPITAAQNMPSRQNIGKLGENIKNIDQQTQNIDLKTAKEKLEKAGIAVEKIEKNGSDIEILAKQKVKDFNLNIKIKVKEEKFTETMKTLLELAKLTHLIKTFEKYVGNGVQDIKNCDLRMEGNKIYANITYTKAGANQTINAIIKMENNKINIESLMINGRKKGTGLINWFIARNLPTN